jgi:hypothetical protein
MIGATGIFTGECDQIIDQYGDVRTTLTRGSLQQEIVQWLESGVTPEQVCEQIDLCPNGALCGTCTTLIYYAQMLLADKGTEKEVLQVLEEVSCFFFLVWACVGTDEFTTLFSSHVV